MLLLTITNTTWIIIAALVALVVGLAVGYFITSTLLKKAVTKEETALLEEAKEKAEVIKKERILQAKEKFLQMKDEHEKACDERNRAAQKVRHQLCAVANPQDRDPHVENFFRTDGRIRRADACGAAGENDAFRGDLSDLFKARAVRKHFAVNVAFSDAPRDQLVVLAAEIKNNNHFFCHKTAPVDRKRIFSVSGSSPGKIA